jgi:Domain of unknown function (DUF4389)
MSAYPIIYEQSPPVKRNRLTVFFRNLLLIPHWIWAVLYSIGALFVSLVAWFAVLFTARYPPGMYEFMAGYIRYVTRLAAYSNLIVDVYPPFDGGEHPEYPVRLKIGPPQATYSRVKVFFRYILSIPIYILQAVFSVWIFFVAVALWFVAVIMGKTSPGLTEAMSFPMSYTYRSMAYVYFMTDTYPPVSDSDVMPHLSQPVA